MNKGIEIRGQKGFGTKSFCLFVDEIRNGTFYTVLPVEMKKADQYEEQQPAIKISEEAAQILLNDLWLAGYRPSDGTGNVGQLKATQNHLDDMRKITFDRLKITQ